MNRDPWSIGPGSWGQGAGRVSWAIGPGSSDPFGPGFRHEPEPMGLAPGPQHWSRFVDGTVTKWCPLVPAPATNRDHWLAYIYPLPVSTECTAMFFWSAVGELCGALAHLLCIWGVQWNAQATLKLSPLEAPCPSSIFLKIRLGLALRPVLSPSSPPSIARAHLGADTIVVSLFFLSSF